MASFKEFLVKTGKVISAFYKAGKAEKEEIKNLKLTEEDKTQGAALAKLCRAGMAAVGIPTFGITDEMLTTILAYGLRDLKDGVEINDKLIINRVIKELKAI